KQNRIDHNRVWHREKRNRTSAEGERRHGDECIGRVEVAAYQEPRDHRAEAPAAETPFVQQIEIALAPMRRRETKPSDEPKQRDKNDQSGPIDVGHGTSLQSYLPDLNPASD